MNTAENSVTAGTDLQQLLQIGQRRLSGGVGWLADARRRGAEQLASMQLPDRKQEAWRYTPVSFLDQARYEAIVDGPFEALRLDDIEDLLEDAVVEYFKSWANIVQVNPQAKSTDSASPAQGPVRTASLKQLDKFVSRHPTAGSNPSSIGSKKLTRATRKLPQQIILKNDECLALVDTGSSTNAADAGVVFPVCVNKVGQ